MPGRKGQSLRTLSPSYVSDTKENLRFRWYVAGLLCLATALNYLDRQSLSVLLTTIQKDLGFGSVQYSWITSAFLLSYTVMNLVNGRVVDRFGPKKVFTYAAFGWSIVNALHTFAHSVFQLASLRFTLGIFESANYPAGIRTIAEWFPMKERALGMGIFNAGSALGAAAAAPIVSYVAIAMGWRQAFCVTGLLGLAWVALWTLTYRNPDTALSSKSTTKSAATDDQSSARRRPISVKTLLSMRETWGYVAVRILVDPITYFLNFWIPQYLVSRRGFSLADLGAYAWIPFFALSLGNIAGGGVPLSLVSRGWTVNRARMTTMLVDTCLIATCFLLVVIANNPAWALACLTLLMFGHGAWGNVAIPAEVFPQIAIGTISGLAGACGGVSGIVTQLCTGWVVERFSYNWLFFGCAAMYVTAFLIVPLVIGPLGVIRDIG